MPATPEVVGTMGQLPAGAVTLVETIEDARAFTPRDPEALAFVTQTTLSVDDTARSSIACASASPPSSVLTRRTSATPRPTARRR